MRVCVTAFVILVLIDVVSAATPRRYPPDRIAIYRVERADFPLETLEAIEGYFREADTDGSDIGQGYLSLERIETLRIHSGVMLSQYRGVAGSGEAREVTLARMRRVVDRIRHLERTLRRDLAAKGADDQVFFFMDPEAAIVRPAFVSRYLVDEELGEVIDWVEGLPRLLTQSEPLSRWDQPGIGMSKAEAIEVLRGISEGSEAILGTLRDHRGTEPGTIARREANHITILELKERQVRLLFEPNEAGGCRLIDIVPWSRLVGD